jgi:hypothetical protein
MPDAELTGRHHDGTGALGIVEGPGVDPEPPSRPANGRDLPGVVGRGDEQEGLDGRGRRRHRSRKTRSIPAITGQPHDHGLWMKYGNLPGRLRRESEAMGAHRSG